MIIDIIGLIINFSTFLVLAITLYWVWKYTAETAGMKKEMIQQKNLTIQPFFILVHDYQNGHELYLKNIGKGAAIEVEVRFKDGKKKYILSSKDKNISVKGTKFEVIREDKSEKIPLSFYATEDGGGANGLDQDFGLFRHPLLENTESNNQTGFDINLIVEYKNILGEKRAPQTFKIENGKISLAPSSYFNLQK